MKFFKKILFILGIITIFLITPLSFELQKVPTHTTNQMDGTSLALSVTPLVAYAQSKSYPMTDDGLLDCHDNSIGVSFSCGLVNFVYIIGVQAGNYLVGMSAILMDFFLDHSLKSSSYNGSPFIKQGWEILRDITNIVFIFALLFIAFQMVLGAGSGKAKSYLIKIILITLTINFSLFFTYAIIDSSNIFAHVFYNKINQSSVAFQTNLGSGNQSLNRESTSLAIANKINPQKLFMSNTFKTKGEFLLISIMSGVINGVMIYVFLSVSFLFLGRTLGLWLAAILSPLAFASLTFPKMDTIQYVGFKKWLPSLLQMAFMAPVFIFILYLAVQFMNIYTIGTNAAGMTIQNMLNIIVPLAMIAAIILIAKKVANSMSGDFAGIISGLVGKVIGGTIGVGAMVATGGAAFALGLGGGVTGGITRGLGHASKWIGEQAGGDNKLTKFGEKTIKTGKRMMSTKVYDVTKLPGFNKIASKTGLGNASSFFSKNIAGQSFRGIENKAKLGALKLREMKSDVMRGKDFEEEEAKFNTKKAEYEKEREKRKDGGAATWQEKLIDAESAKKIGEEKRTILLEKAPEDRNKTNKEFIENLKETLSKGVTVNGTAGVPEKIQYTDHTGHTSDHEMVKIDASGAKIPISRAEYEKRKIKEMEENVKQAERDLNNARAKGKKKNIARATSTLANFEEELKAFKKGTLDSIKDQVTKKEKTIEEQAKERTAQTLEKTGVKKNVEAAKRIRTGKVKIEEAPEKGK